MFIFRVESYFGVAKQVFGVSGQKLRGVLGYLRGFDAVTYLSVAVEKRRETLQYRFQYH